MLKPVERYFYPSYMSSRRHRSIFTFTSYFFIFVFCLGKGFSADRITVTIRLLHNGGSVLTATYRR
jgi:hypothetical protein